MFCCALLCVHSIIAIILMGKRELVALLNLSSWCLLIVECLFLAVPWGCLRFVMWYFLIILIFYSYLIGLYYDTKGWKVEIFDIILVVNNLSNARKLYV